MARKWKTGRTVEIGISAEAQRLNDLALAMVIPWADGLPQYYLARDGSNMAERMAEILDATATERYPWQL
jgi:hypothetical protein